MDLMLQSVGHSYNGQTVLEDISLDIPSGQIVCLIGPSGCGKSTLLRLIGGLEQPGAGRVLASAPPADSLNPLTYIFQDFALLPWRTVAGNVALVLEDHALSASERAAIVQDVLARTKLSEFAQALPKQLSGGMKKRAGLARALALDPDVVFLDEPTAGLDPIGASDFDQLILDLQAALGLTVVMVTHDLDSLARICDRIAVLLDKKMVVGTIAELAANPHPWLQSYFHGPRARAAFEGDAENLPTGDDV